MKSLNKFEGCLIAGAAGDALGYVIEFRKINYIRRIFGESGITEFYLNDGKALISDDTQMTLFTANGLLSTDAKDEKKDYVKNIYRAYKDWIYTQSSKSINPYYDTNSWLYYVSALHSLRAPGLTCLGSLRNDQMGTLQNRINYSSGCGAVMRVAPIGLYFSPDIMSEDEIFLLGAKVGAITHGGDLGIIPAACLVTIINNIVYNDDEIEVALSKSLGLAKKYFNGKDLEYFLSLIRKSLTLANTKDIDDYDAISQIGSGWTGDEALSIALYSSIKYKKDIKKALVVAVNHDGDSDSTGSITGQILGAYLGIDNIPNEYIDKLELKDIILKLAQDLYNGITDSDLKDVNSEASKKYVYNKYPR